jgi:hypothetical protein
MRGEVAALDDRWSLRLEVSEDEIERLYAQGLTRGALVWRDGMVGWRPLLTTQQLASRLLHTRITLTDAGDAALDDEVTLPRPARVPSDVARAENPEEARDVPTVAPTALDLAVPSPPHRRGTLALVAALAFGLAWFARGSSEGPAQAPMAAAAAVPTAAAPVAPALCAPDVSSSIPIVALADLPLLGGATVAAATVSTPGLARASTTRPVTARRSSSEGPTRQELMAALSRVAGVASGCGERDGAVRVVITFANSGVARSIQVSGSGLPSQVRSCIIGAASRARVASFSGEPVTVSKSL